MNVPAATGANTVSSVDGPGLRPGPAGSSALSTTLRVCGSTLRPTAMTRLPPTPSAGTRLAHWSPTSPMPAARRCWRPGPERHEAPPRLPAGAGPRQCLRPPGPDHARRVRRGPAPAHRRYAARPAPRGSLGCSTAAAAVPVSPPGHPVPTRERPCRPPERRRPPCCRRAAGRRPAAPRPVPRGRHTHQALGNHKMGTLNGS